MGIFRMPSLGADMEAGTLVEWLKQPGDTLKAGDIVAVVETQKGAIEIEVFSAGVLESYLVDPGTTVPVGAPMAEIRGLDGDVSAPPSPAAAAAKPTPVFARAPVVPSTAAPPPRAPQVPVGTVTASPAARKLAAEHKIDLARVTGSGPDGAVLFTDVEAVLKHPQATPPPVQPSATAQPPQAQAQGMRAAIAAAMTRSKRDIPHYYLAHSMEIGTALDWLARQNAELPPSRRILPAALFVKALALALRKLPEFNGHYRDGDFVPSERVHIGLAIALRGGGLVAPAIHDTDTLPVADVMARLRDLVARVRAGRFRSSELSDPTITLTSLGDRGVDMVMPVIYPPQVAILGLGTPRARPWVSEDSIVARPVVDASLAGDHRVSDGHRGALLLAAWADLLQHPETL